MRGFVVESTELVIVSLGEESEYNKCVGAGIILWICIQSVPDAVA
jgi:hypothetical protein